MLKIRGKPLIASFVNGITMLQTKTNIGTTLIEHCPLSFASACIALYLKPAKKLKQRFPDCGGFYSTFQPQYNTMANINPHINFNGNAEEAFHFYQSVFGGAFAMVMRFKDLASAEFPVSAAEENKIMHIALPIGNSVLMGNDVPAIMGKTNENEHRSKIVISAASKEEADHLFHGLSAGGQIEMPIADSPWGSYFGMFRDKYGIEWMIDFDPKYKGEV